MSKANHRRLILREIKGYTMAKKRRWKYVNEVPCDGPGCKIIIPLKYAEWFLEGTPKERRPPHYCCGACRQRAYRARHGGHAFGPMNRRPDELPKVGRVTLRAQNA